MSKTTSFTSRDKTRTTLARWLADRLAACGDRIFADGDQWAREHGWQITHSHGGLGRRYRDPRFGALASARRARPESAAVLTAAPGLRGRP